MIYSLEKKKQKTKTKTAQQIHGSTHIIIGHTFFFLFFEKQSVGTLNPE